jgi:hypothetical protein
MLHDNHFFHERPPPDFWILPFSARGLMNQPGPVWPAKAADGLCHQALCLKLKLECHLANLVQAAPSFDREPPGLLLEVRA